MSDPAVLLTIEDGLARLVLNRPDAGNAMDTALVSALLGHARALGERADVRVVVLAAAGRAFCVGGDLKHFASQGDDVARGVRAVADPLHEALELLSSLDAPVVAAVNGVAAGAGMSLVCAADLAIAGESARFTMAYTAAGLSPDGGATWFLPRIVGARRAAELMLLNDRLDAQGCGSARNRDAGRSRRGSRARGGRRRPGARNRANPGLRRREAPAQDIADLDSRGPARRGVSHDRGARGRSGRP